MPVKINSSRHAVGQQKTSSPRSNRVAGWINKTSGQHDENFMNFRKGLLKELLNSTAIYSET